MMTAADFEKRSGLRPNLFVALAAMALGAAGTTQAQAGPVTAEPLTERHAFTDNMELRITLTPEGLPAKVIEIDDVKRIAVIEYTIEPGFQFPWHTHPGSVLVSVTQGELVYIYAEDCVERSYPAGTAFVDPGFDNVHMAFATGNETKTVIVATFLGIPAEGELTLPVDEEEAAALDEACRIER